MVQAGTKTVLVAGGGVTVTLAAVLAGSDIAAIVTASVAALATVAAKVAENRSKRNDQATQRLVDDYDRIDRDNVELRARLELVEGRWHSIRRELLVYESAHRDWSHS